MVKERDQFRNLSSDSIRRNTDFFQITSDGREVKQFAQQLEKTVFGQTQACEEVARALLRARAGFGDPNRPAFVGLFAGETGSGKTEMGRAIARHIRPRDPEAAIKVIDCSDFQDRHDIAKLVGSPPGYVGYGNPDGILITPDFLERPNVIVFDEVEKAHPQLYKTLLSILDKGKLTVQLGTSTYNNVKTVDLNFANSHIILTSNAGAEQIQRAKQGRARMGFNDSARSLQSDNVVEIGRKAVEEHWKTMPEFLGRVDEIVIFNGLTKAVLGKIFDKFLEEENFNQRYGKNRLFVTEAAKQHVIQQTDMKYGARSLKSIFRKLIITPAAAAKLSLTEGVSFIADLDSAEGQEPKIVFWGSRKQESRMKALQQRKEAVIKAPPIPQTGNYEI